MSTIKPPDGRPPVGGTGSESPESSGAAKGAGPSFQEVLEGGPASGAAPAGQAGAAGGPDPVGQLAQAVRAGELSPDQALEQLVERAAGQMAAHLSEAQRAELVAVLREALATDPSLRALREAL